MKEFFESVERIETFFHVSITARFLNYRRIHDYSRPYNRFKQRKYHVRTPILILQDSRIINDL